MSTRAKKRAAAEARRKIVELADQIIRHPPLWPWDAAQWEAPAPPEKRGRGRPPKPERPVDRMMTARAVLNRRFVKKAATAKTAAPKAAAARRRIGDRLRERVLTEARVLINASVPANDLARRIAVILDAQGEHRDVNNVRRILREARILPPR